MRKLFRRHKKAASLLVLIGLALFLLLLYCGSVILRAYVDTPKVVHKATTNTSLQLRDMSNEFQLILLTVEDPNFYSHHGIDLKTPGAGWTTITQGIVKIYFYDGFTPGTFRYRKLEQSLIACVLNSRVDKQMQLLIFVNSAYFGNYQGKEVIGFTDAAETYFNKEFAALTRDEFIALVAMLVGPNQFNVISQPQRNRERAGKIKRLLNGECKPTGLSDVYYEAC
jgi:membrane peptidoglycan carboxypeptidase